QFTVRIGGRDAHLSARSSFLLFLRFSLEGEFLKTGLLAEFDQLLHVSCRDFGIGADNDSDRLRVDLLGLGDAGLSVELRAEILDLEVAAPPRKISGS